LNQRKLYILNHNIVVVLSSYYTTKRRYNTNYTGKYAILIKQSMQRNTRSYHNNAR